MQKNDGNFCSEKKKMMGAGVTPIIGVKKWGVSPCESV